MTFFQRFVRFFFATISPIFPQLAGKLAFELFKHPHAKKTRQREMALYNEFECRRIPHPQEDLFLYEKGPVDGYPVILVHGWESNPGSMYALANTLQENGCRAKVLGLPAHGKSKLKKTNMVSASEIIKHLLVYESHESGFSIVTHSFGSGASAMALKDTYIKIDKLIFLTSTDRIIDIFAQFRDMIKLGDKAYQNLINRVEKMIPYKMEDFNISTFLQAVDYKGLVILHDEEDRVLPFKNALAIKEANPDAELIKLNGLGHYRLLWDQSVLEIVLDKISKP